MREAVEGRAEVVEFGFATVPELSYFGESYFSFVVNTLTVSVVERRREFGLYRAVGATRRQLLGVVTGEAALMATLAGALGLLGGRGPHDRDRH